MEVKENKEQSPSFSILELSVKENEEDLIMLLYFLKIILHSVKIEIIDCNE